MATRAFGYLGATLYEAVRPGMTGYETLAGQVNGLDALPQPDMRMKYHWPTRANVALAEMTRSLFPTATAQNIAALKTA